MAQHQEAFNTTGRAAELVPSQVEVGGKEFRVRRTGKALKEIIAMSPDDEAADDPQLNITMLYAGIALVLVDQDGNHPTAEFLENELDFEVAQELMEKFLPRRDEGNEEASSSTNGSVDQA